MLGLGRLSNTILAGCIGINMLVCTAAALIGDKQLFMLGAGSGVLCFVGIFINDKLDEERNNE